MGGRPEEADSRLVQDAVAYAKAGDPEGLHFLYLRYAPDVERYVNSVVHDRHEAEDITQGVFAKLITTIGKYEQREVPFTAWILRVARNAALDHMRARRAIPTEDVRMADTGQAQVGLDRSRALREALEDLPDDQREVLVLRHVVGLSPTGNRRDNRQDRELGPRTAPSRPAQPQDQPDRARRRPGRRQLASPRRPGVQSSFPKVLEHALRDATRRRAPPRSRSPPGRPGVRATRPAFAPPLRARAAARHRARAPTRLPSCSPRSVDGTDQPGRRGDASCR